MTTTSFEAVLQDYESRPRSLSPQFVESIPWSDVSRHALPGAFIPVLSYMRNVEKLTEVYFQELRRSPTGRNPVVRRFMDRWNEEEAQHGDLLERFLAEAGYPGGEGWFQRLKAEIPRHYRMESYVYSILSQVAGKAFSALHMTWGAINELSTLQGYRRLIELTDHPVLHRLLRGIMQEESTHIYFYFNIARLELERSRFSQRFARRALERFWRPVGHGIRPAHETDLVIGALFQGEAGERAILRHVNDRIAGLPGFEGFDAVIRRIRERTAA